MFSILIQLWKILTPLDKRKLLVVLILVVIMAGIEAIGVVSIMPFLAVLANPTVIESNLLLQKISKILLVSDTRQFIVYLGVISLIIVICSTVIKIITQYALYRFSNLQRHYFSTRLLEIYLQQPYEFFIEKNSSNLIKNILSEVDEFVRGIIQPILFLIAYSVVILCVISILVCYDPIMAISTAFILMFFYIIIFLSVKKVLDRIGQSFVEANEIRYQACSEVLGGIKDIIINHAEKQYIEKVDHSSRLYSLHLATKETLGQVPLHIVETIGYGCIIILAITLVVSGKEISHILPILGLYGIAAYRMLPAAQNIYRAVSQIKFSQKVFNVIKNEFLLEREKIDFKPDYKLKFEKIIQLENICFSYSSRSDHLVFDDFNLNIQKNQSIGIVGKSGSGKSTLMDIMLGLLHPNNGKILIDGVELNQNNIQAWYQIVGYVPQSIYLADKSIAENIAFGLDVEQIDMQAVRLAAQQAQIDEFIVKQLPQAYQTKVGERGVMLSGGQRQRIGIARALYKNPQILFMDEATSALDIETEHAVNEAIQNLSGKKTIVIIAHRESAVNNCDKVIKL
ncbi:ABC transporter ATP-binding protein [Acinetobacter proteolyticus]|uniref:ABC transporter ATP-binding protein n=1 Tax=Acinetobacter proteolyticus TaxID=1776741 RepID=UPI00086317B2|nr:ABC transporter ATP-binding protein [Acinetobacter proteolyticus]OEY93526.1 ABC transporter ATP-binding protein [Acinetobacter proteolyticus]